MKLSYQRENWFAAVSNRFISKVDIDRQASDEEYDRPTVAAQVYTDFTVGYEVNANMRFSAGINNVLDKEPPSNAKTYLGGSTINGDAAFYDNIGRFFHASVTTKF